jgi:hypothetical protein
MSTKETEILSILTEAYPDLDVGPGTPFYEMVVRPMAFLWTRQAEGNAELISSNVLENYKTMRSEDLDRLITRFFEERKVGDYVHATVRIVFDTLRDYYIPKGLSITLPDTRTYTTDSDYYFSKLELPGSEELGYYVDVTITSTAKGNAYNAYMNELVTIEDESVAVYVSKAFVLQDSSDGGVIESNTDVYNRVKSSMTLKNLTAYRGVRGILMENFNVKEVVPIGLRDAEMRRDLIELPGAGVIHKGGMSDFYVRAEPYSIVQGYNQPLGFPYAFNGKSIETDPNGLMAEWNAQDFGDVDIFNRGSMNETIAGLSPQTNMFGLTSNIQPMHDFATHTEHEALHSNNLIKQMWPLVVRGKIRVTDKRGSSVKSTVQSAFVKYITELNGSRSPKVSEIAHCIRNAGVSIVHLPMELECYYISENLDMQKFGLNGVRVPASSVLKPTEIDGLKFLVDDDTQISIRTCVFYTNANLITVEVV